MIKLFSSALAVTVVSFANLVVASPSEDVQPMNCNRVQQTLSWSILEVEQIAENLKAEVSKAVAKEPGVFEDVIDILTKRQTSAKSTIESTPLETQTLEIARLVNSTFSISEKSDEPFSNLDSLEQTVKVLKKVSTMPSEQLFSDLVLDEQLARILKAQTYFQAALKDSHACTK